MSEVGISIQHGLLCLKTIIFNEFAGQADPLPFVESADLGLGICKKLTRGGFDLAGLNVQLAIEDIGSTEGADTGLITLDCCQIVNTGFFQKITYAFYKLTSC